VNITGLTLSQFRQCAYQVSNDSYGNNVTVHQDGHSLPAQRNGTQQCVARLAVYDSRGPGSRTAASGRHGPYACWHAYRSVLAKVFTRYPDAVIRTRMATYRGMRGFVDNYPQTAHVNIGSAINPVTMSELCACTRNVQTNAVLGGYEATVVPPMYSNPDYISPEIERASRQYAESRKLLGDHIDQYVFGPMDYKKSGDIW
jgi:hypothetical protein